MGSARDAIIGKTLDGIITSWNAGAQEMYGYTAAGITGHSIADLIPPTGPANSPRFSPSSHAPARVVSVRDRLTYPPGPAHQRRESA